MKTKLKIVTIVASLFVSTGVVADDCHDCGSGGDLSQQQGVNNSASPTFNNSSTMAGSQSNVSVQNVQMSQQQMIMGVSCSDGVNVMGGAYGNKNESDPWGYQSTNVGVQIQVGTTFFDNNLDTCSDAQKAVLIKLQHEAVTNKFQFCGNFYMTMNDPRAPRFNFKAIGYQARRGNAIAKQIMECISFIQMDSVEHHQNFANATPKMKSDFEVGRQGKELNELKKRNAELELRLSRAEQSYKK